MAVGDEGVFREGVAFRSRREMNADGTAFKPVAPERVFRRIIYKYAFGFTVRHPVIFDDGAVRIVQQETVIAVIF